MGTGWFSRMASTGPHCALIYSPFLCVLSISAIFQFHNKLYFSHVPLYIEHVINVVKLLGEASLVAINVIKLFVYVPLNFINVQLAPFFHNHHFS
jgi:hypothetical protein